MKRLTLASLLGGAVILLAAGCNPDKKEPPVPKVGSKETAKVVDLGPLPKLGAAPVWELKDLDGKAVTSEQLKGKVVVVDFWATWCAPCRMEIPGYIEMQKKYGKDGLMIVGVSLDQAGPEVVKAFVDKFQVNYTVVMGDDAIAQVFGGIEAMPTTFLIDRSGQIRDRKLGAEESETYEQKVLAVLKHG